GQCLDELDFSWILVPRHVSLRKILNLGLEQFARLYAITQHQERLYYLATDFIGAANGRGLQHRWVTNKAAFHLERRNSIAACFDHIVVAPFEPEVTIFISGKNVA